MKVKLGKSKENKIEKISKKYFPNEGCALLTGEIRNNEINILKVIEAKNTLKSPTSFKMDPILVAEITEKLENQENKELIGFFHSHPNLSAFVSDLDKKCMKIWPKKIWIIAGTNKKGELKDIKAFKWEKQPVEVDLVYG